MFDFSCASACNPPNPAANTVKALPGLNISTFCIFDFLEVTILANSPAIWCYGATFSWFISSSDFFPACQVNMEDIAKRTAEAQTDWGLTGAVRTTSFPWHSSGWYVWFCRYDCTNLPCCLLYFSWHFILQTLVAILVRKLRPSARCEPYLWGLSGGRSGRSRGQTC